MARAKKSVFFLHVSVLAHLHNTGCKTPRLFPLNIERNKRLGRPGAYFNFSTFLTPFFSQIGRWVGQRLLVPSLVLTQSAVRKVHQRHSSSLARLSVCSVTCLLPQLHLSNVTDLLPRHTWSWLNNCQINNFRILQEMSGFILHGGEGSVFCYQRLWTVETLHCVNSQLCSDSLRLLQLICLLAQVVFR